MRMSYSGLAKQRTVTLQRKDDREFGACAVAWLLHARAEFAPELGQRIGRSASRFDRACREKCQEGDDEDFPHSVHSLFAPLSLPHVGQWERSIRSGSYSLEDDQGDRARPETVAQHVA